MKQIIKLVARAASMTKAKQAGGYTELIRRWLIERVSQWIIVP